MGGAESTPYLKFLANDKCAFLPLYPQTADAPATATLQGDEGLDAAEVHLQLLAHQSRQLLLTILHTPTVEIGGLRVIVVEHLGKHTLVGGVAKSGRTAQNPLAGGLLHTQVGKGCRQTVGHGTEVGFRHVLPAILKFLGHTTAALAEACVAYLATMAKHLSAGGLHRLRHALLRGTGDALVALAVVVGAHVEDGVVLAVVPSDDLVLLLDE